MLLSLFRDGDQRQLHHVIEVAIEQMFVKSKSDGCFFLLLPSESRRESV